MEHGPKKAGSVFNYKRPSVIDIDLDQVFNGLFHDGTGMAKWLAARICEWVSDGCIESRQSFTVHCCDHLGFYFTYVPSHTHIFYFTVTLPYPIYIYRFDNLGNGRGQCITPDAERFVATIREFPERVLRCSCESCVLHGDRPPMFDDEGVPFRQFVSDAQYNLLQPLIKLLSRSLRLRRLPSCVGKNPADVWKKYRDENKSGWRVHRKSRIVLRNKWFCYAFRRA